MQLIQKNTRQKFCEHLYFLQCQGGVCRRGWLWQALKIKYYEIRQRITDRRHRSTESGEHKARHRINAQCVVGVPVVQKAVGGLANMQ